jgi:gas vesicle protein
MVMFLRFFFGALLGGGLGAIIGLLLAPRAGSETRLLIKEDIQTRYDANKNKACNLVHDKASELKQKATELSAEMEAAGRKLLDGHDDSAI